MYLRHASCESYRVFCDSEGRAAEFRVATFALQSDF